MWSYQQSTGKMLDSSGGLFATGYSGHGAGVNNPALQTARDIGPIPQGVWKMTTWIEHHPHLGLGVIPLEQIEGDSFGRSGFFLHGDTAAHNQSASHGCIILGAAWQRQEMWAGGDRTINVVV